MENLHEIKQEGAEIFETIVCFGSNDNNSNKPIIVTSIKC